MIKQTESTGPQQNISSKLPDPEEYLKMPSAVKIAELRKREVELERQLLAMQEADSPGSDSEAMLAGALEALRVPDAPRAAPPAAAAVLERLAAALPAAELPDAHFLEDYLCVLHSNDVTKIEAVTEELIQSIESALARSGGAALGGRAGGVVLGSWLGAAAVWAWPRVARAPAALQYLVQHFDPQQVERLARALHAALEPRELLALSDAMRGAGALAALLQRAALAAALQTPVEWRAEALDADEARAALLSAHWAALGATAQLDALRAAARALPALPPPPPRLAQEVSRAWNSVQQICKPEQ